MPAFFAVAFAAVSAVAAVKPGENLLLNGTFEADQADFPPFWAANNRSKPCLKWNPGGGPNGLPCITVVGSKCPDIRLRQFGLNLVAGGLYRLSMQVRTKGLSTGSHSGVMLVNSGLWKSTEGVLSLPKDTAGAWRKVEKEFKCFAAPNGYTVMIHTTNQRGELDVADVRLEAIDEWALAKSGPSKIVECETRPRLVPLWPKLSKIPLGDRCVSFRFFGELEDEDNSYEVVLGADGAAERVHAPLSREAMRMPLPHGATNGQMSVSVVRKATGHVAVRRKWNFRVVDRESTCGGKQRKRLNNLCTEVLSVPLTAEGTNRFSFATVRDGWTFTAVKGRASSGFSVRIDGQEVINSATPRHETFRRLPAGGHVLEVAGTGDGGVVVREIAEILNYCPGVNSGVEENPPYDWTFNERYVLPAVTTQLGGNVPKEHLEEFRRWGYRWMGNMNLTGGKAELMIAKLASCKGMKDRDGVACDEQNYADVAAIDAYANGLWEYELAKRPAKPVYTWAYGKPTSGAACQDFFAACANVSGGEGKLLRELYCATKGTEEEARRHLGIYVADNMNRYRAIGEWAMESVGLVFGNFNQVPILSIAHHPEVDYKYSLDMQMNFAANDPSCRNLGLIGYWGSYYADEELHRWSFALMRHYVVEGGTNMLSSAYGFRYNPGHLLDGDFRKGLAAWRTNGDVRADSHEMFASRSQNRWGASGGVGDTFAVLVRGKDAASSLSQTLKGLVPGRKYCLQFATFDAKDVKANRVAPRRFAVEATLSDGAEIDKSLSWVHVDRRIKGRYEANNGVARINLHHIVFTAKATEVELTLDNAAATPGEELGVNYVSLNPYFAR